MHSGEELVTMYEKAYKINIVGRVFLVELIDTALKEVHDSAKDDVIRVARHLAKQIIEEEKGTVHK